MKKTFFLLSVCVTLLIVSFKPPAANPQPESKFSTDINVTLNGFTKDEATKMIVDCKGTIDRRPSDTHIWFSLQELKDMLTLLDSDHPNGLNEVPDGIRLYFIRDLKGPIHANNKIVIVSTYYTGVGVDDGDTVRVHSDYFNHSKEVLAKISPINGIISMDKNPQNGILLYNTSGSQQTSCRIIDPEHDITRGTSEQMVQHFHRILIFRRGDINSIAEWFNIGMLRNLIISMEQNMNDGVRIYFSRGTIKDYTYKKSKFVWVPTKQEITPNTTDTIHRDDFGCGNQFYGNTGRHKTPLTQQDKDYLNSFLKANQFTNDDARKRIDAIASGGGLDNGELCPNHCQGITP